MKMTVEQFKKYLREQIAIELESQAGEQKFKKFIDGIERGIGWIDPTDVKRQWNAMFGTSLAQDEEKSLLKLLGSKGLLKDDVDEQAKLESQASDAAKKKGLTHSGFGKYKDKSGKVVAMSKGGKLVPVKGKQGAAPEKGKAQTTTNTKSGDSKLSPAAKKIYDLMKTKRQYLGKGLEYKRNWKYPMIFPGATPEEKQAYAQFHKDTIEPRDKAELDQSRKKDAEGTWKYEPLNKWAQQQKAEKATTSAPNKQRLKQELAKLNKAYKDYDQKINKCFDSNNGVLKNKSLYNKLDKEQDKIMDQIIDKEDELRGVGKQKSQEKPAKDKGYGFDPKNMTVVSAKGNKEDPWPGNRADMFNDEPSEKGKQITNVCQKLGLNKKVVDGLYMIMTDGHMDAEMNAGEEDESENYTVKDIQKSAPIVKSLQSNPKFIAAIKDLRNKAYHGQELSPTVDKLLSDESGGMTSTKLALAIKKDYKL
jgi:hypothetical protein